jgi:hypothetical protein
VRSGELSAALPCVSPGSNEPLARRSCRVGHAPPDDSQLSSARWRWQIGREIVQRGGRTHPATLNASVHAAVLLIARSLSTRAEGVAESQVTALRMIVLDEVRSGGASSSRAAIRTHSAAW